ncbi:MAG: hypothetical protein HOK21_22240 [Rhodospirillaceae bacterium]|jgi:hypothetical protein|nr:hypothetical protein [Rhodospirillaceae bacterium]MBT4688962.1 hypothetical protein [Rhodospirillaceae bacterium]MBT5082340.1 hypothetical protein [Rhodospirillaceae bacterium]MBT5526814.1 hypothetical protein [Rhodospirillaceae bacterium]MBT5878022.1 hypothetical protein [Rhodospirillaceae bacterium]
MQDIKGRLGRPAHLCPASFSPLGTDPFAGDFMAARSQVEIPSNEPLDNMTYKDDALDNQLPPYQPTVPWQIPDKQ